MNFIKRYTIRAWVWNGVSYERDYVEHFDDKHMARCNFDMLKVSEDMPQIELWLEIVNKYGCTIDDELIAIKE